MRAGIDLPGGLLGGALQFERECGGSLPDSFDGGSVRSQLPFVAHAYSGNHQPEIQTLQRDGRDGYGLRSLIDAVQLGAVRTRIVFRDLYDKPQVLRAPV